MHSAAWALFLLSTVFTPLHSQEPCSFFYESETDLRKNTLMVEQLNAELAVLRSAMKMHGVAIRDILTKKFDQIVFEKQVINLTVSANEQLKNVYDLKEKLEKHEKSINGSLTRQEDQLSKLEPQLRNLENQWRNQSSELEQLKQLWGDLGSKSVARAADVKSLELSIKGVEERLLQQEAKVGESESATNSLDNSLENAEESLKVLQDVVQESLNKQDRLEGVLETLKNQIALLQAGGGGKSVPGVPATEADNICKRMMGS